MSSIDDGPVEGFRHDERGTATEALVPGLCSFSGCACAYESERGQVLGNHEGEFLGNPGSVVVTSTGASPAVFETSDSMTPPALATKDSDDIATEFPIPDMTDEGVVSVQLDGTDDPHPAVKETGALQQKQATGPVQMRLLESFGHRTRAEKYQQIGNIDGIVSNHEQQIIKFTLEGNSDICVGVREYVMIIELELWKNQESPELL